MNRRDFLATVSAASPALALGQSKEPATDAINVAATDWPWWRGLTRDGVAAPGQKPPTEWSATKNVLWEAPVLGRGHGGPAVVGTRVFLATADEQTETQGVLCLDRKTGKQLWHTELHRGSFEKKGLNAKATHASATPASDGTHVYINFLNAGAVFTTALDLDGKELWRTKVTDYTLHQGFGSSPAVYKSLALVTADNKRGGAVAGLERTTGKIVWTVPRPKAPNYASPIVLTAAGKEQLIVIGCDLVSSYDPLTGKLLWETKGATTECVTSTVTDGKLVFTSGGYPKNHVSAVKADGTAAIAWENKSRVYVPSMLIRGGHLYAVMDDGIAVCWKADTGAEVWKGRLGGTFSSSGVLVGENVYATNEAGRTFIFKAVPDGLDVLAENDLGNEVFASPAVCGDRIYLRVAVKTQGKREEKLYCLGTTG